jgi:uncharacterized protein (TIGR03382 family)
MAMSRRAGVAIVLCTLATSAEAAPAIELEPTRFDFLEQEIEVQSVFGNFLIHNTGDVPLDVTDMVIVGPDADQFQFAELFDLPCGGTQHCPIDFTVAPGEQRSAGVVVEASRSGDLAATLVVTSNAGNAAGHSEIALTAIGMRHGVLAVSPPSLIMPVTRADSFPTTVRLTITNTALPPAALLDVRIDGPPWQNPHAFTVSHECPPSGPCGGMAGESVDVVITFHPRSPGLFEGPIVITTQWGAPVEVPFHALAGYPLLTIDQPANGAMLSLPPVPVGMTSTGTIVAHSSGELSLWFFRPLSSSEPQITITGGPAAGEALAPGEVVTWQVSCTPTSTDGASTQVFFDTNSENESQHLTISCAGLAPPQVSVSASSVQFADTVRHPVSPTTQTVSLTNTGEAPLELTTIATEGEGFSVISPATATIAPGASQDIVIGFSPAMVAAYTGHLIAGNANFPMVARIDLSGTGIARNIAVSPLAIDLGSVEVGGSIRLGDVVAGGIAIHNVDAAAPFTLTSVTISDGAFTLVGPDRTQLGPGELATLDAVFAPAAAGSQTAAIELFVDGDPEPHARIVLAALATEPAPPEPSPPAPAEPPAPRPAGCAASGGGSSAWLLAAFAGAGLLRRRRRRAALRFAAISS